MANLSDLTAQCIRCGFCLESCPTFVISGKETESPRGRIHLARALAEGTIEDPAELADSIDSCLGCRACETACPSGVHYGEILELTRARLEEANPRKARRQFVRGLTSPRLSALQIGLAPLWPGERIPSFLGRQLTDEPPEAGLPRPERPAPWRELEPSELPPVVGEVLLLEGCVMRSLYPGVHEATRRLLRRVGFEVNPADLGCCGALPAHSGFLEDAEALAQALAAKAKGEIPIVVNSAGCGSTIREYGGVVGRGLESVAGRAVDASVFLERHGLTQQLAESPGLPATRITYHDACHLAHGQGVRAEPRKLLAAIPGATLVPLDEAEFCCGSAGTYNVFSPARARQLLMRKWERIDQTGANIVAMGNPGCQSWIAQAARERVSPIAVAHTMEVLEASFSGWRTT